MNKLVVWLIGLDCQISMGLMTTVDSCKKVQPFSILTGQLELQFKCQNDSCAKTDRSVMGLSDEKEFNLGLNARKDSAIRTGFTPCRPSTFFEKIRYYQETHRGTGGNITQMARPFCSRGPVAPFPLLCRKLLIVLSSVVGHWKEMDQRAPSGSGSADWRTSMVRMSNRGRRINLSLT